MSAPIQFDGDKISTAGIYADVPMSAYHDDLCAGPSISSSGLRRLTGESPAHFWAQCYLNPERVEPKETEALTIGKAAHFLVLGQPRFAAEFSIRPEEMPDPKTGEMKPWQGNRTVCKDWLAGQERAGRTVLSGEMVTAIKGMAIALGKHPLVRAGILNGGVERTIVYQDKETGIWVKVRPDAIPTDSGDFSDLKSCMSVQWLSLMRSVTDWQYHAQAALIRTAAREVLGLPYDSFTFTLVFVEKEPPYCVRMVQIKPDDLALGERQNTAALRLFKKCLDANNWPGPGEHEEAAYIDLLDSYRTRAEEQLKGMTDD